MKEEKLIQLVERFNPTIIFDCPGKFYDWVLDLVSPPDLSVPVVVRPVAKNSRGSVEEIKPLNDIDRLRMDAYLCVLKELSYYRNGGGINGFKGMVSVRTLDNLRYEQSGGSFCYFHVRDKGGGRNIVLSFRVANSGAGEKRGYVFDVGESPSLVRERFVNFGLWLR